MIIKSVALEKVCGPTSPFFVSGKPEFAFAGKSNVGKSSLLNALVNRKNLAHVSGKPGKTGTINYYNVNNAFYLVDLPGYGYAAVSEETKADWGKMIERYLYRSQDLTIVFLLLDIRHKPSDNEFLMFDWICRNKFTPVLLFTKADKLSPAAQQKALGEMKKLFPETVRMLLTSAEKKTGITELWQILEENL